jgi:predicted flap endonuclease-1-like 5' DNA nuclease
LAAPVVTPSTPFTAPAPTAPRQTPIPRPPLSVPPRTVPSPPAGAADASAQQAEHAELMQARHDLMALKVDVANLKIERRKLSDELTAARSQIETQVKTLNAQRERITELEAKVAHNSALKARVVELEEATVRMQELEFKIEEMTEKLAERESLVGNLQSQLVTLPPASGSQSDDLKNIRGIGPKFEKNLRALGITTYRQIADWTPADITSFAEKLKLKPERIVREDWVGRARKLLDG